MTYPKLTQSAAAEERLGSGVPAAHSLLDAPDALEAYLADVKRRREVRRAERRRYWQEAAQRLRVELEAARAEQDEEIAAELRQVLESFESALASVPEFRAAESATSGEQAPKAQALKAAPGLSVPGSNGVHSAAVPAPAVPAPPPMDDAARAKLTAWCQALRGRIAAHLEAEIGGLTHAIEARALFCEGQALALNPDTPDTGRQALTDPLDDLAASPLSWADGYPFSLRQPDFNAWVELACLYKDCAAAAGALDWYLAHEDEVPDEARVGVLNAVAAAQQRVYRSADGTGRRDQAVYEMYQCIRAVSQNTGFIRALSPAAGDAELAELADSGGRLLAEVRAEVEERQARAGREAVKEAAVAAVLAWEDALEGRAVTSETLEADRTALCGLLDHCLAAGVSPTNIKVRTAILDTAPVLLEEQPRYAKFLDAVNSERAKRSLAAIEVAPPEKEVKDDDFRRLVSAVAEFTRGKTVVMLGGKSRPQVAQELSDLLECEVVWHDSDPGDKFAKFASKLKKADIVLLLKNYASHEIFYGSKDAMAADGKHFVVLPSGYGVRQVVFQLSEYAARTAPLREKMLSSANL